VNVSSRPLKTMSGLVVSGVETERNYSYNIGTSTGHTFPRLIHGHLFINQQVRELKQEVVEKLSLNLPLITVSLEVSHRTAHG